MGNVIEQPSPDESTVECVDSSGKLLWVATRLNSDLEPVGPLRFRLRQIVLALGRPVLIADKLFAHGFTACGGDRISGCVIREIDIPRSLDESGEQRLDRFAFVLEPDEHPTCHPGDIVELIQQRG